MVNLKNSKILFIFFVISVVTGCSRLEMAIDWAPRLIANRVNEAFNLSSEKKKQLKESIRLQISTYKEKFKSDSAEVLNLVESSFFNEPPLTAESLTKLFDLFAVKQNEFLVHFRPTIELAIADLSPEQLQHFKKYNEDRFSAQERDVATVEKSQEKLKKGLVRSFEFFLDDLTKDQITEFKVFSEKYQAYPLQQIKFRKEFVEIFYQAATERQIAEKQTTASKALFDLVLQRFSLASLAELKPSEKKQFTEANLQLILKIWGMANPEQKANFKKEISELKEMISALP